jgi:hypothetical protein
MQLPYISNQLICYEAAEAAALTEGVTLKIGALAPNATKRVMRIKYMRVSDD